MGVLAISLTGLLVVISRSVSGQFESIQDYEITAMARTVLEEYVVTYPAMAKEGTYRDRWSWTITERPAERIRPSPYDPNFDLVEVRVSVKALGRGDSVNLATVITRRPKSE